MKKLYNWIKDHKLSTVLILVVGYLLFAKSPMRPLTSLSGAGIGSSSMDYGGYAGEDMAMMGAAPATGMGGATYKAAVPQTNVTDRKVITESNLSLLVKNVRETMEEIKTKVTSAGGYAVNTNIQSPEEGSSGYITVRVPAEKLDQILGELRGLAVKVVSENIRGHDITDQYVDIEARLATLQKTKTIYEGILTQATDVDEILRVQSKILGVQDQIDALKGQLQYMDAASTTTLITINLSEDEYSLPYAPSESWRPGVVFKMAVRSLVKTLRSLASAGIWLGVYAVILVPAFIIFKVVIKVIKKRKAGGDNQLK